ncbi:NPH3 domain-containing protein, partial [Cephalotus follicularis]
LFASHTFILSAPLPRDNTLIPASSSKEAHFSFMASLELLAARSAKVSALLEANSEEDLSYFLHEIPADPEICQLVARFCHGFELSMCTVNVVPLICLAYYLEMTESHSPNNLLTKALTFFEQRILPSWNETIKAFRSAEHILQQAVPLGLVEACLESMVAKALIDPRLLGEPIKNSPNGADSDDDSRGYMPNARRRLFDTNWQSEDLTALSLQLYEPIIHKMNKGRVLPEYVAASLFQYAKKWAFSSHLTGESTSIYKTNSQRDVIEAVEKLLPDERGLLPCKLLFEMLRSAISLEASYECRNGFEIRIGKQLDQATVKDLIIPSQGYAKELQYDIECVRRILKNFYASYTDSNISRLITVSELIEELLAEIASDIDLKTNKFTSLAEISVTLSIGTQRKSDRIYRAIDIYLDKHRFLTESERLEVCRVLEIQKMSPEACEHAAKNERLPMRVVLQVLFVAQLRLRDAITKEGQASDDNLRNEEVEQEEEEAAQLGCEEEQVKTEMTKMSCKVLELERECNMMRKEIESGCCSSHTVKKGKVSMWREMKRKLGCMSSIHDCNCQVKKMKVHPKY